VRLFIFFYLKQKSDGINPSPKQNLLLSTSRLADGFIPSAPGYKKEKTPLKD